MSYRKKLIEVALPLEAINRESAWWWPGPRSRNWLPQPRRPRVVHSFSEVATGARCLSGVEAEYGIRHSRKDT